MKKVIILTVMLFCGFLHLQAQTVTRNGNNFTQVKTTKTTIQKTTFAYTIQEKTYPVFINTESGRCFINKVSSKTGKEYRYYLPEEVAKQICNELNIEYKSKEQKKQ